MKIRASLKKIARLINSRLKLLILGDPPQEPICLESGKIYEIRFSPDAQRAQVINRPDYHSVVCVYGSTNDFNNNQAQYRVVLEPNEPFIFCDISESTIITSTSALLCAVQNNDGSIFNPLLLVPYGLQIGE